MNPRDVMGRIPTEIGRLLRDDPICLIDVGARGGVPPKWQPLRHLLKTVGFEPDTQELENLRRAALPNEVYIGRPLYSRVAEVTLYCTRDPNCSSIYPPNTELLEQLGRATPRLEVERTETLDATTLDAALADHGIARADFLKVDTQGSELDVLKGAEQILRKNPIGIELEVEFAPLYRGQALFPDVHRFLVDRGFFLMGFPNLGTSATARTTHAGLGQFVGRWLRNVTSPAGALRGAKQLVYADAVFLLSPDRLMDDLRGAPSATHHLAKAVTCCCVTNYYDYAFLLIDRALRERLIDDDSATTFKEFVRSDSRSFAKLAADVGRFASRMQHRLSHLGE